ncbi:EF-hand domain-containing protein [Sphingomonas sp. MMS24-J13]|uniref:EF-hand domain-containing protein n=1 Tax=Sphingomonas sp. MMS24-J13 TaxID=3238686 RepID=UPI00384CF3F7
MRTFLLATAAATLVAIPASARMPGRDPAAMLDKADTDHDGRISRAEFIAARAADFARLDRNGDGVISRLDFTRILKFRPQAAARIDAMIAAMDSDHDGKVTRAELAAAPPLLFDRADADHDNFVDKAELAQLRTMMQQMKPGG